jgi:hypothetical protein
MGSIPLSTIETCITENIDPDAPGKTVDPKTPWLYRNGLFEEELYLVNGQDSSMYYLVHKRNYWYNMFVQTKMKIVSGFFSVNKNSQLS